MGTDRRLFIVLCWVLAGMTSFCACRGRASQSEAQGDPSVTFAQFEEVRRLLGTKGTQAYELLKAGHLEAASRLITNLGYSASPAVASVLRACEQLAGSDMYRGPDMMSLVQRQIQEQYAQLMVGRALANESPLAAFDRACILDRRWQTLWPHMALDIMTARLGDLAAQDQGLVVAGDDVLISPDDRYTSEKKQDQGVVLRRHTGAELMNPDAFDLADLQSRMGVALLASQRHQHRHFLLGGGWTEVMSTMLAAHPTVRDPWQASLMRTAETFGDRGRYASALLVKKTVWDQTSQGPAEVFDKGLAWLEATSDRAAGDPESAHNLLVGLGYWWDAHQDALEAEAKSAAASRLKVLIRGAMPVAGVCEAVILGHHLHLDMLSVEPSFAEVQEPWENDAQACAWFEQAGSTEDPEQRASLLQQAAMAGHAPAMETLAFLCDRQKQAKLAFTWLSRAAKAGYPSAINNLGVFYIRGTGCRRDQDKALELYGRAAGYGLPQALYSYGALYQSEICRMNLPVTVTLCSYAAQRGCAEALYDMGWFYLRGNTCVAKSVEKAIQCWEKAGALGLPEASYNLYLCLMRGEGTPKDPNAAIAHLKAAADGQYSEAMYQLYLHYRDGVHVAQDFELALRWLRLAGEHKHDKARRILAQIQQQRRAAITSAEAAARSMSPAYGGYDQGYDAARAQQELDLAYQRAQEEAARQMRHYRLNRRANMARYGVGY